MSFLKRSPPPPPVPPTTYTWSDLTQSDLDLLRIALAYYGGVPTDASIKARVREMRMEITP